MTRTRRGTVRLAITALVAGGALAASGHATAQLAKKPGRPTPPPSLSPASPAGATNVRSHVGVELAARFLRSNDPEERIRGIQRAAAIGSPEAVALLAQSLESSAILRSDSRALVAFARALAPFAEQERARVGLLVIVSAGNPGLAARLTGAGRADPRGDMLAADEGDPVARAELARQIAALALARTGGDKALEALYGIARGAGSGQSAAIGALTTFPPKDAGFFGTTGGTMPTSVVQMLGTLGDLRALDVLHAAARSTDIPIRCAALIALAELGDERAITLARTAIAEGDARLRAAAGEAFVLLNAPERLPATTALISDEATTAIGIHLAERVHTPAVTRLLAPRAENHPDRELRYAAIHALGRSSDPGAASALARRELYADETSGYHAALALARSPAPNALAAIEALAASHPGLGVRAYVVRTLKRRERSEALEQRIAALASSADPKQRALGVFARVALGDAPLATHLDDKDARVRRAAAMASSSAPSRERDQLLLARLAKEPDDLTRQVLAAGLASGDPKASMTTTALVDRAESGGSDAPLATYALTARADDTLARVAGNLLSSKDAVIRAHAARGLALAPLADASGRLADAFEYETDVDVRRAIVSALAARTRDAAAPARKRTLDIAAELDPDGVVRLLARRARGGAAVPLAQAGARTGEPGWLRVATERAKAPESAFGAYLLGADGTVVPVVSDDEGFIIVPRVSPGEARLVLAPRLPSYEASAAGRAPKAATTP